MLDLLYERKAPFNPSEVVSDISGLLKGYHCGRIVGDKYGAQWTVEAFAKCGVKYEQSERDRSAVYIDCLPIFTSGRVRLLDNPKLVSQFAALERRTFATGREQVIPGPGHDDCANSVAIALSLCDAKKAPIKISDAAMQRFKRPPQWGPHGQRTPDPRAVDVYSLLEPMMRGRQ